MVVNGQNGVEVGTEINWRHSAKAKTPVVFLVNHLEHENSSFEETLRQLKQQFHGGVVPIQYPVNEGIGFNAIIDVLQQKMLKYPANGGKAEVLDIPDSEKDKAAEMHAALNGKIL